MDLIMNKKQTLQEFVESNPKLVTRKESKNYPGLYVLKYTRKVFYDNLWNTSPHLLDCRGTIVDVNYDPVITPFTKIFNYKENGAGMTIKPHQFVLVTKKVNGFMAGLTNVNGRLIVSTTGSLDSDFVGYAQEYLKDIPVKMIPKNLTYMFEICHPSDPHIIKEKEGAHFLGIVERDTLNHHYKFDDSIIIEDAVNNFPQFGIHVDDDDGEPVCIQFHELLTKIKTVAHEGYVVISPVSGETFKIKSPYYLFNKFLARIGTDKLISGIKHGTIKQRIDEEYYPIIDTLVEYGVESFSELEEQNRLSLLKEWINKL